MFGTFLTGFILYVIAVFVAYSSDIKSGPYYIPVGIAIAICTNLLWLYMIKTNQTQNEIMVKSFTWDGMRMLIYAIVPILFLDAPFSSNKLIACILIGCGMILLNFG